MLGLRPNDWRTQQLRSDLMNWPAELLWIFFVCVFPAIKCSQSEIERHLDMGKEFLSKGQFADALTHYHAAIELDPTNYQTLYRRATVLLAMGRSKSAVTDLDQVIELKPDFTALKADPSNHEVQHKVETVKQVKDFIRDAESSFKSGDYANAEYYYTKAIEAGHIGEAITMCTEFLKSSNPNDLDVLCDRAEAYLVNEQYDEAIADFQKAVKEHDSSRRAQEGLNKAQKLKKQSGKKDYYKILRVKRNANKREIMKAYRKLAQQWHPDNFSDEKEKKKAEKMFIDIASAKEVLTDAEKRAQFDKGEDPLDPEQQQHGGFQNPFYGGFPFAGDGGPFSFKFHFG
ncbi:unnamed protein product [Anisakis simplex]|uniref:DnaJ homolog subfamily C member 3 (inferred by orthology to a human protein) n=1 Tax=Anisakis simplex TaxID=6269 RepID=A0A0M3K9N7_ANISI|nr:unnamed protein product [Anisakis simplex]